MTSNLASGWELSSALGDVRSFEANEIFYSPVQDMENFHDIAAIIYRRSTPPSASTIYWQHSHTGTGDWETITESTISLLRSSPFAFVLEGPDRRFVRLAVNPTDVAVGLHLLFLIKGNIKNTHLDYNPDNIIQSLGYGY